MKFIITLILSILSIILTTTSTANVSKSANMREEELILMSVETAYESSLMKNNGNSPTLNEVKENFSVDNLSWIGDKIETKNGIV